MGRIGGIIRKIGRGIRWAGNHIVRPVASLIAHPASQALLSTVGGPYGKIIGTVGGAVNAGINIMDGLTGGPGKS